MKYQIEITQADIDLIPPQHCTVQTCPAARAISRATGKPAVVYDAVFAIYGSLHLVESPWIMSNFVKSFDEGRPVSPLSFMVDMPGAERETYR